MKTYFALSDIHSSEVTMQSFLDAGFDPSNDNHIIVLLGDYFDRRKGNAYQVVTLIEYLKENYPTRSHILMGNHDEMLLDILKQIDMLSTPESVFVSHLDLQLYKLNGGGPTLRELIGGVTKSAEYTPAKRKRVRRYIDLIESFEPYFETEDYIFVHAGIDNERNVDTWDRDIMFRENTTGKTIINGHTRFDSYGDSVEIKHDKAGSIAYNPNLQNFVFGIDDGTGTNIVKIRE